MRAFIFDTETGGLEPERHSVLSIGITARNIDTNEIFEEFETLVKYPSIDDYCITDKAIEINKLADNPKEAAERCFEEGMPLEDLQEKLWRFTP